MGTAPRTAMAMERAHEGEYRVGGKACYGWGEWLRVCFPWPRTNIRDRQHGTYNIRERRYERKRSERMKTTVDVLSFSLWRVLCWAFGSHGRGTESTGPK